MKSSADQILSFLHKAEKLKCELRHSWLSSVRQESVAEHVWRTSLMALLCFPHLNEKIDLFKSLKMVIIHDLVEIETGDTPVFMQEACDIFQKELQAIEKIRALVGGPVGEEIYALWHEFNERKTSEARFVFALDKLEANLQHNESYEGTWTEDDKNQVFNIDRACHHDPFLRAINEQIKKDAKLRMHPKIGCGVFVIRDGKVLLGKRKSKHGQGQWASPGGHLEHGEEPEDCAKREVDEETGLQIKNIRQATYTNHVFEGTAKHYVTLWMVSEYAGGTAQVKEPDKFEQWDWFDWNHLPSPLFTEEALLKAGFNPLNFMAIFTAS